MNFAGILVIGIFFLLPTRAIPFNPATRSPLTLRLGSQYCQGCHDGVIAIDVGREHPVGMDYRLAQIKSRGRLRELSQLDPVIKLDDGRLGCLSCHHPDSQHRGKVVISNADSRLCFSCHNL